MNVIGLFEQSDSSGRIFARPTRGEDRHRFGASRRSKLRLPDALWPNSVKSSFCITFALLAPMLLNGQATSGAILGYVSDPTGGRVLGAEVTAIDLGTQFKVNSGTNDEGAFAISNLPPGLYELQVRKPGFATASRTGLELHIDQRLHLDVVLELTLYKETAVVAEPESVLQDQSAETGEVIDSRQILDLPSLGRNFLDLILLIPGVNSGAGGNTANYSINGQREFSNSIIVNGIEVTGNRNNDTNIRPGLESVLELKAVTSTYAPEFGRSAGGVIDIQTRGGTNAWHGSLFDFVRTNKTTARTFFAAEPSGLKENDFGLTLGGPLRKNGTFVFASYEGHRQRNVFSYLDTTVPSCMIKVVPNGGVDLSGLRDPYTGKEIPIFDPSFYSMNFYAEQFTGNIIPADRVSKAGLQVLRNLFPMPNAPGIFNGWFNNFQVSQHYLYNSDTGSLRLDHSFDDRNRLTATFDVTNFKSLLNDPFAGAIPIPGGGGADSADRTESLNQSYGITFTRILTPSQINELRVSFVDTPLTQNTLIQGDIASQLGIGNVNVAGFPATAGLPQVYLAFGALTGGSTYKPLSFRDENFGLADSYVWNRGAHGFKFGYEYRHLVANPNFSLFPTGFQYYSGAYASLTSDPTYTFYDPSAYYGNGGSEIADLLLGLPGSVTLGLQLVKPRTTSFENHFYLQDSWRLSSRLTLSYGVRYEYQAPYAEAENHQANFDPATGGLMLAGSGGNSRALVWPDKNNFAPRFGLAWHAAPSLVVRGGYGIFYTPENSARSEMLTENYPFLNEQTYVNNTGGPVAYLLDRGVPRATSIPATGPTADLKTIAGGSTYSISYLDPNFRTGYSQMFNFTLQKEIKHLLTVEAGYVGALSHKLPYEVSNLNLAGTISPQLGRIVALFSEGNGAYHSLQVKAERRLRNSLGFLVAYTFSKNIDNGPAPFDLLFNHQQPQVPLNLAAERGLASIDVRHNLVASYEWQLPIGRGKLLLGNSGPVVQALLGGWRFNGIVSLRSGLPVNVVRNGNQVGYSGLRPNVLRKPNLDPSQRTLTRYFDTSAFSVTGLSATSPGDAGRDIVQGPGSANTDVALVKDLVSRESRMLQFRVDAFNLTNTPHFANPNADLSQGQFGTITNTIGNPRILQFAMRLSF